MTPTTVKSWEPQQLSDAQVAFPAQALDWMPTRDECKAALDEMPAKERDRWLRFAHDWFFKGLPKGVEFHARAGVDPEMAFRHLQAIQGSFAPKHEHKEEAVAFLASNWFKEIK